jgi:flagellar hook-associated protein 3 FlgL
MRITNSVSLRNALAQLSTNRTAIDDLQAQISSGLRIQKASDDPAAAHEVMRASSSLTALDQYKKNIDLLNSRNSVEGSTMDQLTNIMARAKELMVGQATDTATTATRATAAAEMEQLFRSAVQLGTTKFGDEYMFGGDTSTQVPFTATGAGTTLDFTSTTPSGTRSVEIGDGQSLVATHSGQELFADRGILASLRDATRALLTGDVTTVQGAMNPVDTAFNNLQTIQGDQGARTNALDVAGQNIAALKSNLTAYRSNLQDVDVETAVTSLVTRQTAYQAAMLATSKIIGMNLTDYLR